MFTKILKDLKEVEMSYAKFFFYKIMKQKKRELF